jgi:uncharacterized protein (DUF1330 family)
MTPRGLVLVAILTVRKDALEKFRAFERHAAEAMARYGGRIERTVVVVPDAAPGLTKEIHVITFPSEQAFAAYRNDEQLARVAGLRDESVVQTELFAGEDGPSYAAG